MFPNESHSNHLHLKQATKSQCGAPGSADDADGEVSVHVDGYANGQSSLRMEGGQAYLEGGGEGVHTRMGVTS